MATAHVYDWLKSRGYWVGFGDPAAPTHLLLDGGKARVPDEAHGAFLNAYAASLLRHPERRPCLVELRTPVFKMFVDLDTRFGSQETAHAASRGAIMALIARLGAVVCPEGTRALVCVASAPKPEADGSVKLGFHVVWPDVRVTTATARELRAQMLASLADVPPAELGLVAPWESIVDATVFRGNGLRMPWSAKGRGDGRYYELRWVVGSDGSADQVEPATVSALREALHQLSIRTWGPETVRLASADDDEAAAAAGGDDKPVPKQLAAYADVLPRLAAALPVEFLGQKFTGVLATEHCFMLRSTARYCFNLGRTHRTNNVYFVLTKQGITQRCYCRCETTEGRRQGLCKDFVSPCWQVPKDVLAAFFPDCADDPHGAPADQERPAASVAPMPSRAARSYLNLESLMARSRPAMSPAAKRRKRA